MFNQGISLPALLTHKWSMVMQFNSKCCKKKKKSKIQLKFKDLIGFI